MSNPVQPTYQPLKCDGAPFKCVDCGERKNAANLWFVCTPDGKRRIICKDCIDPEWLTAYAQYIDVPM